MEVNARLGGDMIPYLGELATGVDPARVAVDVALGREPEVRRSRSAVAEIRFLYPSEDLVVRAVGVPQPGAIAGLHLAEATAREGAVLRLPPHGYLARYAQLICVAEDRATARAAADRASRRRAPALRPLPPPSRATAPTCRGSTPPSRPPRDEPAVRQRPDEPAHERSRECAGCSSGSSSTSSARSSRSSSSSSSSTREPSEGRAGLALGAYGAGSVLGALLGGRLADRLGRRTTMTLSMLCAAALTISISVPRVARSSIRSCCSSWPSPTAR